MKLIY